MSSVKIPEAVVSSLQNLRSYIERSAYKGYDPYDGLMSPLYDLPVLRSSHKLRFYAQQLIKRSPVNLRPLLGVRKNVNPVTLGLCLQGYTPLAAGGDKNAESSCRELVDRLSGMTSKGFHGACWGYDFHWEARYARIPAFQPTVVATGIIANALFKYCIVTGDKTAGELVAGSAEFVIKDLNRTTDSAGNICFSYSPFDHQVVFNASLKGARLLVQAGSLKGNRNYFEEAIKAARYVAGRQCEDGSWTYADKKGAWTDNYHTGYVLDCLEEIGRLYNTNEFTSTIKKGFTYYRDNFFEANRIPKFYNKSVFPVDCTAAAQSILTLIRFNELERAMKVAEYMASEMQSDKGYFYFRKYRYHTEKTPFMRWSDAWMFAALGELDAASRR